MMKYVKKSVQGKEEKDSVCVLIPFFNRIPLVLRAVQSAMEQTHKNTEILLIDDGSSESLEKLEEFIEGDSRVRIVRMGKNYGAAAARNEGFRQSNSDYVAFLDSDDFFLPEKLAKQIALMKKNNARISHTSYIRRYSGTDKYVNTSHINGTVMPAILKDCPIATPTVMIKRDLILERNLRFQEMFSIGEDVCLWIDVLSKENILGIPEAYTVVNVTEESSARSEAKQLEGMGNILSFVLSRRELSSYHREIRSLCLRYVDISRKVSQKASESESVENSRLRGPYPKSRVLRTIRSARQFGIKRTIQIGISKRLLRALRKLESII